MKNAKIITIAILLAVALFITGCGQEESQIITPEEECLLAPVNMMDIKSEASDKVLFKIGEENANHASMIQINADSSKAF